MADLSGRDIGRYHIVERLGEGGMATVYRAFDTNLEREVAIKVIRFASFAPELVEEMLKRFEREAKSLAKMMHANIVPIYDYGKFDGSPFLVMAYVPGGTLKKWVGKPLDYHQAAWLLLPVARALAYAHRQGVVHRDVKPANILITTAGDPMLSDFGVAKILEGDSGSTITGAGVGIGTPEYMAPEQWENRVTPQTDIYALGVVLYELVTGRVPYSADTPAAVLRMQLVEPLPRPRSIVLSLPEEVERVLFKALAKKPADRYASMDEMAAALEGLAGTAQAARAVKVRTVPPLPAEPEKPPRPEKDAGKVRHVPTLQGAGPFSETAGKAGKQEEKVNSARWRIPLWGYLLGGLVILGLVVGGVWALAALGGPKETPTAAVVAQVTDTPILTVAPSSSMTPTLPPTLVSSPTLGVGSTLVAPKDGMVMMYVPAGPFLMGSDKSKDSLANNNELPQHTVYLDAYWIDQTEVTNAMYAQCVQGRKCQPPDTNSSHTRSSYYGNEAYGSYPVVGVTWNYANDYCTWAGQRLPSEAEWEKAARGTDGRIYPWGNAADGTKANCAGKDTTAVSSYPSGASPYGVLDMAGNVWQWVADWYDAAYYQNSPTSNPPGPKTGQYRVLKGTPWFWESWGVRSAARSECQSECASDDFGFRCATSP